MEKSQVRREDMKGNLIPTVIMHILHQEEKTYKVNPVQSYTKKVYLTILGERLSLCFHVLH